MSFTSSGTLDQSIAIQPKTSDTLGKTHQIFAILEGKSSTSGWIKVFEFTTSCVVEDFVTTEETISITYKVWLKMVETDFNSKWRQDPSCGYSLKTADYEFTNDWTSAIRGT